MDTFLAIASKREVRTYADTPIPQDVERRILEAGRVTGSAANKQLWRFIVVQSPEKLDALAECVYVPGNVLGSALVIAIASPSGAGPAQFDAGRAAQDLKLAAWNDGVGSCPNGFRDGGRAAEILGLEEGEGAILLTFGYPEKKIDPESRKPEEWIAKANRKSFDEVVVRI